MLERVVGTVGCGCAFGTTDGMFNWRKVSCMQLGRAFHRNSAKFRRDLANRHQPERNVTGTGTGINYNTILDILVYSGWYLSTRFLQVENAHNYSK